MQKANLQLEELACPACVQKIETAIKNMPGVSKVKVLFNASKAKVEFDESQTDAEKIAEKISGIGYDVLKIS